MMEEFRAINPKSGLKDAIFYVLTNHKDVLTIEKLVNSIRRLGVTFDVNPNVVNRVLQKMAKQNLVEFVYIDLSYGVRLKRNIPIAG